MDLTPELSGVGALVGHVALVDVRNGDPWIIEAEPENGVRDISGS